MNDTNIPGLKIEAHDDDTLTLEQDWSGNIDRVTVHALHLRFMAERMGLVREVSATEADTLRTVTTLKRRLRVLRERCEHLGRYLAITSDSAHADLTYEQNYSEATADIADEFCADLDDLAPCTATSHAGVTRDATGTSAGQTQQKPIGNPGENQRVHTQLALEA